MKKTNLLKVMLHMGFGSESCSTRYYNELSEKLSDALSETLTSDTQRDLLDALWTLGETARPNAFNEGVLYGLQLARELKQLLENPEEFFEAMNSSAPSFREQCCDELSALYKYEQLKQTEADTTDRGDMNQEAAE